MECVGVCVVAHCHVCICGAYMWQSVWLYLFLPNVGGDRCTYVKVRGPGGELCVCGGAVSGRDEGVGGIFM